MSRVLIILVILGALLDGSVFAFQVTQYRQLTEIGAKSKCWDHVLDNALNGPITKHKHAQLVAQAEKCKAIN